MTCYDDRFEFSPRRFFPRIAVSALALLGVATILAATLQIVGSAFAAPEPRVIPDGDASLVASDDALQHGIHRAVIEAPQDF